MEAHIPQKLYREFSRPITFCLCLLLCYLCALFEIEMVKVSVIVPFFNEEKSLGRCIDGILSQTYKDYELILVDDGSSDKSSAICDSYAGQDGRIRVIHQDNKGLSGARNAGMAIAEGEYIAFADADDYMDDKWLDTFLKYGDFDYVIQGCKAITPHSDGRELDFANYPMQGTPKDFDWLMLNCYNNAHNIGSCWARLFRNDIIRANSLMFDEGLSLLEDNDFVMRYIPYVRSFKVSEECHYHYTQPDYSVKYAFVDPLRQAYNQLNIFKALDKIMHSEMGRIMATRYYSLALDWCLSAREKSSGAEILSFLKEAEPYWERICQPFCNKAGRKFIKKYKNRFGRFLIKSGF